MSEGLTTTNIMGQRSTIISSKKKNIPSFTTCLLSSCSSFFSPEAEGYRCTRGLRSVSAGSHKH